MAFFSNLYAHNKFKVTEPFTSLRDIRWRAEQILKKEDLTPEELESVARGINKGISDYKEEKIAEEIERHVQNLYENGGWELDFLEDFDNDRQPSIDEIKDLLKNWPSWADDKPDIPSEENICDLFALQDIFNSGYTYWDYNGFSCDGMASSYAVLALMKLDDVFGLLNAPEVVNDKGIWIHLGKRQWESSDLVNAGNLIVEAMEIVCYAERELSDEQLDEWRKEQKEKTELERAAAKAKQFDFSAIGKAGAKKRHAAMRELEKWAVAQRGIGDLRTANKAAHDMREAVIQYGKTIGANLSDENAQRTIAEWFRKNKKLSA